MLVDICEGLHFPVHTSITNENLAADIVISSESCRRVHLVELTVPWEGNLLFAKESQGK